MQDPHYDMNKSTMNGWIQTYTGRQVFPLALTPDQVCIEDIAHALALKTRFGGHCLEPYSIAQHSICVCERTPPGYKAAALMHDAAEYILPDVASPIKHMLPGFKELEDRVLGVICERFGISYPFSTECKRIIKHIDNVAVVTERRDLMKPTGMTWDVPAEADDTTRVRARPWVRVEQEFLQCAGWLGLS